MNESVPSLSLCFEQLMQNNKKKVDFICDKVCIIEIGQNATQNIKHTLIISKIGLMCIYLVLHQKSHQIHCSVHCKGLESDLSTCP